MVPVVKPPLPEIKKTSTPASAVIRINKADLLPPKENEIKEPLNLIQKAHNMYNQKYPQKVISITKPQPRVNNVAEGLDLPTIDEAEQKEEQNTFAQGMPL